MYEVGMGMFETGREVREDHGRKERLELLKEVNKQKNSFVLKMWETS